MRELFARWEIRMFRGIDRFSDYKRIKARMLPTAVNAETGKIGWRFLLSDRGLTRIVAIGTVALVLFAAATLIVILL